MSLFQPSTIDNTTTLISGITTLTATVLVPALAIIAPILAQRNAGVIKGWEGLGKGYENTIAMKDKQIESLERRMVIAEKAIDDLKRANARITELETQNKTQADEIQVLKTQAAEIPGLKAQNAAQEIKIQTQESEIQTLRAQVAALQKGATP